MRLSKLEQVERLTRALVAREVEYQANEDVLKRATVRRHSLKAAITDLRATIAGLLGEAAREPAPELSPAVMQALSGSPGTHRIEGTILERVSAYLDSEARVFSAQEIAQGLGLGVDVVRTSLSKLFARQSIQRFGAGEYCSLKYAKLIAGARGVK